jgi:hypothetical protein
MVFGLPWTSWLLIVSPAVIGLALALRFRYVHADDTRATAEGEADA